MPSPKLPRNVRLLSWISLLNDLSSEMALTTLPLFLRNVLGVPAAVVGLIEGVADSTATLLRVFAGYLSDRMGRRKPLVATGYTVSSVTKPLLYFAGSWPLVMAVRFADRVGKGVRNAPRDALIADSTPPEARGRSFGYHRAMDTAGAVLALALAAGLVYLSQRNALAMGRETYRLLVLVAAVPGLALLFLLPLVRDVRGEGPNRVNLSLRGFAPRFYLLLGAVLLFTMGNSSDAFLILRAQSLGVTVFHTFLMLAAFNLVMTVSSYPAGVLSDHIGRKRLILFGWGVYALIYLGFALARTGGQVMALYVAYGLYHGTTQGTANALISDLVPAARRGTAYGLYNTVVGLAAFPASLVAGLLWDALGPAAPFLLGASLAGGALVMLGMAFREERGGQLPMGPSGPPNGARQP